MQVLNKKNAIHSSVSSHQFYRDGTQIVDRRNQYGNDVSGRRKKNFRVRGSRGKRNTIKDGKSAGAQHHKSRVGAQLERRGGPKTRRDGMRYPNAYEQGSYQSCLPPPMQSTDHETQNHQKPNPTATFLSILPPSVSFDSSDDHSNDGHCTNSLHPLPKSYPGLSSTSSVQNGSQNEQVFHHMPHCVDGYLPFQMSQQRGSDTASSEVEQQNFFNHLSSVYNFDSHQSPNGEIGGSLFMTSPRSFLVGKVE